MHEDLQAGAKLCERTIVAHPQHRERAVVHVIPRALLEHRTDQLAERMPQERRELGVHDGVDRMDPLLLPLPVETLEAERSTPFLDSLGLGVKFADESGGLLCSCSRDVGGGRDVLVNAPESPATAVTRGP